MKDKNVTLHDFGLNQFLQSEQNTIYLFNKSGN